MGCLASVIVTSYNQENTIRQTLESILKQDCLFEFEIIIADDCSTDKTQTIAQEYYEKFPKIFVLDYKTENLGVGSNWALSVEKAKGEFIFTCAADDFWHDTRKLQLQVEYMINHKACGLLYSDYDVLDSSKKKNTRSYLTKTKSNTLSGINLMQAIFSGKVPILTLTTCFRKSLFDSYIPVNDYVRFRFPLEDWPTFLILSKYTQIDYLPISLATYRKGHDSISNPSTFEKMQKKFHHEHTMYRYLCDRFRDELVYNENDYLNYQDSSFLSLCFKKKSFEKAHFYAQQLHKRKFYNLKTRVAHFRVLFYVYCFYQNFKDY